VANVRVHDATRERPVDRFQKEQGLLRPLPLAPFNTEELVSVVVNSHARVNFDGNRYSVPPELARKTALLRADRSEVRVLYQGRQLACHPRSYDRGQLIRHPDHELAALQMRRRVRATEVENQFDTLGEEARKFHLELRRRPLKTSVHLRRLLKLVPLYGRQEVVAAIWERRACRQRFQRVGEQRGVVYFAVSFSPSTVDLDLHRLLPCLIPFLLRIAACVVGGVFLPILEDGCP
jgi:hypothetical protein